MAANHDFEVKQLLKAYRKGIISDELFESEMKELWNGEGAGQYVFNGKSYNSEREMLVAFWMNIAVPRTLQQSIWAVGMM